MKVLPIMTTTPIRTYISNLMSTPIRAYVSSLAVYEIAIAILVISVPTALVINGIIEQNRKQRRKAREMQSQPDLSHLTQTFGQRFNSLSLVLYRQFANAKKRQPPSSVERNFVFFTETIAVILGAVCAGAPKPLEGIKELGWDETFNGKDICKGVQGLAASLMKREKALPKGFLTHDISYAAPLRIGHELHLPMEVVPFEQILFRNAAEATQLSNAWIEKQTQGKIKGFIQDLEAETVLLLITTALFSGKWLYRFDPKNTQASNFYNADGTTVKVETMCSGYVDDIRYGRYKVGKGESAIRAEVLELPFHGEVDMFIVKPCLEGTKAKTDYESFINSLAEDKPFADLLQYIQSDPSFYKQSNLRVYVPKLHMEDEIELLEDCPNWRLIQTVRKVDFRGSLVSKRKDNGDKKPIMVEQISSKTVFKMDEEGAEIVSVSSARFIPQSCPPTCEVNRPFLFFLRDRKERVILAMGRILNLEGPEGDPFQRRERE